MSCGPDALSNYFQRDSPLPLEMSQASSEPKSFIGTRLIRTNTNCVIARFIVGVLGSCAPSTSMIKARSIPTCVTCVTYPTTSSFTGRRFNEWPKGPLSKRAITTDFKGEYYAEYNSLNSIKQKIRSLDDRKPVWWAVRGDDLATAVHYPATTSSAEWANEILALDHLIIEGFRERALRSLAASLGCVLQPDWKSLRLLQECLAAVRP